LDLEREKFDFDDAQEGFLVARLKQFIDWNFYQKNAEVYQDYSQSYFHHALTRDICN
jgi:hypothetical protein